MTMMNLPTIDEPLSIKPLKPDPLDARGGADYRDYAKNGWSINALETMCSNIDNQPNYWRDRADMEMGYVDGKQFTEAQRRALAAEGMPDARPTNLLAKTVRVMCGQEAKARSSVKVEADDDESQDTCDVLNPAMAEARREAKVDIAISAAYQHEVAIGLGWVKVDTDPDPLNYPDRVRQVDRRNIWWDWDALDPLLKDARWLVHMEWADLDELEASMPKFRDVLRQSADGWGSVFGGVNDWDVHQVDAFNNYRYWTQYRQRSEWFDAGRRRMKMFEVWYRVPAQAIVLQLGPTKRVLFDEKNQSHINAVTSGRCRIFKSLTSQVRCSLYAGPNRLYDYGTKRRQFPYVPFFAYRDDQDRTPYGLVAGMIGPQDQYNQRRLRINWMLRARQILVDNDALDKQANSLAQIADAIMRPDLTVVLNPDRKNVNGFQVMNNLAMQREQIEVMQDDKQNLQDVPGFYGSQLGQAASGVTSGIANSLLIEQGTIAMGDLNDAYRDSRQLVHEILLDQIIERHSAEKLEIKVGRGSNARVVVLNDTDEQGNIVNGVYDVNTRVGLGDQPNSPAYRLQQQQNTAMVIQALAAVSPQAAAVMVPGYIEATDLPDRMERADDVRKALGIPTAGDKKAAAEAQEQQAAEAAQMKQLQQKGMVLALEDAAAKVNKTKSETELNKAKTVEIGFNMGHEQATAAHDMTGQDRDRAQSERAEQQSAEQAAQPDPAADRQALIAAALAEAQGQPLQ